MAGMACPICGEEVHAQELVRPCGVCGMPVHSRCWDEGCGCARPDCPCKRDVAQALLPADAARPRGVGALVTMLLISALVPVIGGMLGIVVGFVWMDPSNSPDKRRDGRTLLVFSVIAFILSLVETAMQFANLAQMMTEGGLGGVG
jgi:hypothetical protein